VGNRIIQRTLGGCSTPTQQCCGTLSYASTGMNVYDLGSYQRTTDWIQQFGNGDTCPGGKQRTAEVEFENSDGRMVFSSGDTYSVRPSEPATCVYKFVIYTSPTNYDAATVYAHDAYGPPSPSPPPFSTFSDNQSPPPPTPSPPPPWDDDGWIGWDFQWWWVGMPVFFGLVTVSMVRRRRLQQSAAARRQNFHVTSTPGIAAMPIPVRSAPGSVTRTVNLTTTTTSTVGDSYPTATAVPVTATAIPAYPGSQPPIVEAVAVEPANSGASFGTPIVVNAVPVTTYDLPRV